MLTQTLRKLERDGYATRTVAPSIGPRVDHELTNLGQSLLQVLEPLAAWVLDARDAVALARAQYDAREV